MSLKSRLFSAVAAATLTAAVCAAPTSPAAANVGVEVAQTSAVAPAAFKLGGDWRPQCGKGSTQVIWTSPLTFWVWTLSDSKTQSYMGTLWSNDGFQGWRTNGRIFQTCR